MRWRGAQARRRRFSPALAEADDGLGLVAVADHVEDHALAELLVGHVVADVQAELLRAAAADGRRAAALRRPTRSPRRPPRRGASRSRVPPPTAAPARLALRLDQLFGDLGEEPARRVVVRRAEQLPAPRVAEVQPLARPGDADVAEAPFLFERFGITERRACAGRSRPRAR